jgi:hypothetical protein
MSGDYSNRYKPRHRACTYPKRAHGVAGGKWRAPYYVLRVPRLKNGFQSLAGMLQLFNVVGVIPFPDFGNGQAARILDRAVRASA